MPVLYTPFFNKILPTLLLLFLPVGFVKAGEPPPSHDVISMVQESPQPVRGRSTETRPKKPEEPESNIFPSIGFAYGIFQPFQGKAGQSALVQLGGQISLEKHLWFEIEVRDYQTKILKVKNIETQSFILRLLGEYKFRPNTKISPYLGLGFGISLHSSDEDEIQKKRSTIKVEEQIDVGFEALGLLGVETPVWEGLTFFVEGRISADFLMIDFKKQGGEERTAFENTGGMLGLFGIRYQF